jgi:nitroimidazol reductase NimA-like FMN-containing flavoprotein (pyridoxamine 5'-phosphate oxidase superfamily)
VHERPEDIAALQRLLDSSYARAGAHLLSIHTPDRRLSAEQLCARLEEMCLLVLATVSGDCRPFAGPVDGIFYRGAFHFGSAANSVRFRHIGRRPHVSATHAPREEFAVTVHGRAEPVDVRAPDHAGLRDTLFEVYTPRYGEEWAEFLDADIDPPLYARIDAERMFALLIAPSSE